MELNEVNLARCINSRKYLRSQVTLLHSSIDSLKLLDSIKKISKCTFLKNAESELKEYNTFIQNYRYSKNKNDDELTKDIDLCGEYTVKINEVLAVLDNSNASILNKNRTLLKSPTAELPIFSGDDLEDLSKFIFCFEQIVSKFNYSDFDKYLLLKQQCRKKNLHYTWIFTDQKSKLQVCH